MRQPQPQTIDHWAKVIPASSMHVRTLSYGIIKTSRLLDETTERYHQAGLFSERLFGQIKDHRCGCGRFESADYAGIVCDECGVVVGPPDLRQQRFGHIELKLPVVHPWWYGKMWSPVELLCELSPDEVQAILGRQLTIKFDYDTSETEFIEMPLVGVDYYAVDEKIEYVTGAQAIRQWLAWLTEDPRQLQLHDYYNLRLYRPRKRLSTDPVGRGEHVVIDAPDSLDLVEEELVRRQTIRRSGTKEAIGRTLRIAELCKRLNDEFARRNTDLVSVHELGKRFMETADWREAASEMRNLTDRQFHRGLCAELREGDVLLGDIWQATDPEPFHHLINGDEARGRAARSFLALLVATGPDELGKYAWVLKYDEMQTVINLRVLHRRLLQSLGRIFERDRPLLTQALAKNSDPAQLWALVILYNAHRNPKLGSQPQYGQEYGPVSAPDDEIWKRAWTSALRIDRVKVTRLLVSCYEHILDYDFEGKAPHIAPGILSRRPMMCPVGWRLP